MTYTCSCLCILTCSIGGFHVMSSPPCWWTVNKRSLISSLCLSTSLCSFHHCYLCLLRLDARMVGGGGGRGVIDFVELLQMTPRYQTTNWLSVSQESVKHVVFYCWLSIFRMSINRSNSSLSQ